MLRLVRRIKTDSHLRQFSKADRQINVGERIVGEPTAAIASGIHAVLAAAVMKTSVEAIGARHAGGKAGVVTAAELRPCCARNEQHGRNRGDGAPLHGKEVTPDAVGGPERSASLRR